MRQEDKDALFMQHGLSDGIDYVSIEVYDKLKEERDHYRKALDDADLQLFEVQEIIAKAKDEADEPKPTLP